MSRSKRALVAAVVLTAAASSLVAGAVHAATTPTDESCRTKQASVACVVRLRPTRTVTQTVTATVTAVVTATVTATVTAGASPTLGPSPTPSATQTPSSSAMPTPTPTPTPTPSTTPSPTPTSQPTGSPGAFPGPGNTGVPPGTALSAYTGSCTITATVTIDAKTVNCAGGLVVKAANVVIRNSRINGRIVVDTDADRSWSLTLTDSEVNAGNATGVGAISNGNVTIVRANIHGGHNGLQCEEHSAICSMTDSWVHGQYLEGSDHLGGVASFGSVVPCTGPDVGGVPACVVMVHNNIVCEPKPNGSDGGCTGDLNLLPQFGPLHGALIQGNLFGANAGAAYCTYGGALAMRADHIAYRDNVFQRGTNRQCAAYGPVTSFDPSAAGNVWSNNTWDDGTVVQPG